MGSSHHVDIKMNVFKKCLIACMLVINFVYKLLSVFKLFFDVVEMYVIVSFSYLRTEISTKKKIGAM